MKEIELAIKIPEEIRLSLINNIQLSSDQQSICDSCIKQAIINGIPLPKGHGDLKDSNLLDKRLNFILNHTESYKKSPIGTGIVIAMAENLNAEPIVKADREQVEMFNEIGETKNIDKDRCMFCKEMFDSFCGKAKKIVIPAEFFDPPYKPKWCPGRNPSNEYHD